MRKFILAALAATSLITPVLAASSEWKVEDAVDHLDGKVGHVALLNGTMKTTNGQSLEAILAVACIKKETRVVFYQKGGFVIYSSYVEAKVKVDDQPVKSLAVTHSFDSKAFGQWNGKGIDFLKTIKNATVLKVQSADSLTGMHADFTYPIAGAAEAFAPIAADCGWKL